MDGATAVWTILGVLGGLVTIVFGLYRFGIKPQMTNQLEFFKKKFQGLEDDIQAVKNVVENNTKTLSEHGERIASVETQVKMMNGNPGSEEEE